MAQVLCPKCEKPFMTQSGLGWHLERSHPEARQAMLAQDPSRKRLKQPAEQTWSSRRKRSWRN